MLGLLGKIESGPILITEELVARLGRPTRTVDGVGIYELPDCGGSIVHISPSGRKDGLPYAANITAPNDNAYDRAIGKLQG